MISKAEFRENGNNSGTENGNENLQNQCDYEILCQWAPKEFNISLAFWAAQA